MYPRLLAAKCAGIRNLAIPRLPRDKVKFYRSATQQRLVIPGKYFDLEVVTMASNRIIRTTASQCSKTIRCRSLMTSCRYRTWLHLREDADRSNYRPATRLSIATWRSCYCHPTQHHAMFLVLCFLWRLVHS